MHLKMPTQNIIIMDSRSQKRTVITQAFSSDIQQVDITCSINFSVPSDGCRRLYETVGVNYYDTIMMPRLMENIKAVFANYSAEKLIAVRNELSTQVMEHLTREMSVYGITVISLSIEDMDFSDAFTDAVEAKQVAEQTKLRVETEQAQQVSVEKATAERRIITANAEAEERAILAQADADVARIEADAKTREGAPKKTGLFARKQAAPAGDELSAVGSTCILCERIKTTMDRYIETFFVTWKKEAEFKKAFSACKGFCVEHYALLMNAAPANLSGADLSAFTKDLIAVEKTALERIEKELEWFTLKFDYRNADKPWGTSEDAVERTLNKLRMLSIPFPDHEPEARPK